MGKIKDSLNVDLSGYEIVETTDLNKPSITYDNQPTINPMIRCPLPSTTPSPDALRQFYMGNRVPQFRLITK